MSTEPAVETPASPSTDAPPPAEPVLAMDEAAESPPGESPLLLSLRADLEARDSQLRACQTAYRQAISDFDRERERNHRERERALDRDRMQLAGRLLDVLDNLDRSLIGAPTDGTGANLALGVKMVHRQFVEALEEFGVKRMSVVGTRFDANIHEAAGLMPATEHCPDQHIAHEAQAGYTFKGQLLRAAKVIVAQAAE